MSHVLHARNDLVPWARSIETASGDQECSRKSRIGSEIQICFHDILRQCGEHVCSIFDKVYPAPLSLSLADSHKERETRKSARSKTEATLDDVVSINCDIFFFLKKPRVTRTHGKWLTDKYIYINLTSWILIDNIYRQMRKRGEGKEANTSQDTWITYRDCRPKVRPGVSSTWNLASPDRSRHDGGAIHLDNVSRRLTPRRRADIPLIIDRLPSTSCGATRARRPHFEGLDLNQSWPSLLYAVVVST